MLSPPIDQVAPARPGERVALWHWEELPWNVITLVRVRVPPLLEADVAALEVRMEVSTILEVSLPTAVEVTRSLGPIYRIHYSINRA